jgi:hypothetical protein
MLLMNALAMIVSKNRLEGSLSDTPLRELLDACHKHLVTGAIKVSDDKNKRSGVLVLRAGAVDQARFGDSVGDAAVDLMAALEEGTYELAQQLPDLSGELGRAAALEGAVDQVSVVQIMRHCEHNALSAVITVINDFDRGEIHYRAGDLEKVTLNGQPNDDAIVTMLGWPKARYRVAAPPLASDIGGWPKMGREQTQPFKVDDALLPPKEQAAKKRKEDQAERLAKLAQPRPAEAEGFEPAPHIPDEVANAPTVQAPPLKAAAPAAAAAPIPAAPVLPPEALKLPSTTKRAEPLAPRAESRPGGLATTLVQAFLLTLAATLVLTFVALLASR